MGEQLAALKSNLKGLPEAVEHLVDVINGGTQIPDDTLATSLVWMIRRTECSSIDVYNRLNDSASAVRERLIEAV